MSEILHAPTAPTVSTQPSEKTRETVKKTDTKIVALGVIATTLLILATFFGWQWYNVTGKLEVVKNRQKNEPAIQLKATISQNLARAMTLLPSGVIATGGAKISEHLYWIFTEAPGTDNENNRTYQSWVVNLQIGTATMRTSRVFGSPRVVTSFDRADGDEFATIHYDVSWENRHFLDDYVDVKKGTLLATVEWMNEPILIVEKGKKKLTIKYASVGDCSKVEKDQKISVTGLDAGGTVVKFSQPRELVCAANPFSGGEFPDFQNPAYLENSVEFVLPWKEVVNVDLNNLVASGVTLRPLMK